MCYKCHSLPVTIDVDEEINGFRHDLENLVELHSKVDDMSEKDHDFAMDLYGTYTSNHTLSRNQWKWVGKLLERYTKQEPVYGSFDPILVMFRLAGSNGLKKPKIRLIGKKGRFVQLNFKPGEKGEKQIGVYVDGWQGHGYRKFAGWISKDMIIPYDTERMTEEVCDVIQELAMDPMGCAKAMAAKLGACMYCGSRLSDDESKNKGYGPVCAEHFGLPWGQNEYSTDIPQPLLDLLREANGLHPYKEPNMNALKRIMRGFKVKEIERAERHLGL